MNSFTCVTDRSCIMWQTVFCTIPQLAEDAVHQAFLRIMNHMQNISQIECPQTKSFVVIIVRNIAINLYNSRKKKAVLSFDELENWTPDTAATVNEVEDREGMLHLASLIRQLPEGYRSVLLLNMTAATQMNRLLRC